MAKMFFPLNGWRLWWLSADSDEFELENAVVVGGILDENGVKLLVWRDDWFETVQESDLAADEILTGPGVSPTTKDVKEAVERFERRNKRVAQEQAELADEYAALAAKNPPRTRGEHLGLVQEAYARISQKRADAAEQYYEEPWPPKKDGT